VPVRAVGHVEREPVARARLAPAGAAAGTAGRDSAIDPGCGATVRAGGTTVTAVLPARRWTPARECPRYCRRAVVSIRAGETLPAGAPVLTRPQVAGVPAVSSGRLRRMNVLLAEVSVTWPDAWALTVRVDRRRGVVLQRVGVARCRVMVEPEAPVDVP